MTMAPLILHLCVGCLFSMVSATAALDSRNLVPLGSQTSGYLHNSSYRTIDIFSSKEMIQFLHSFYLASPPHQLYLLYDDTYPGMDAILKLYSENGAESTVIKYTPCVGTLYDILSTPLTVTNTGRRHIYIFCSSQNIDEVFKMVSSRNAENRWLWWVIFTKEEKVTQTLPRLLREGSQVLIVQITKQHTFTFLTSRVKQDGSIGFYDVGRWTPTSRAHQNHLPKAMFLQLEDLYSDFQGRQITVAANNNSPFFGMKESSGREGIPDTGIDISIMNSLSRYLNFTYRVMKPADGKWGGPLPDGTITGMIGEVSRREADVAICEITITGTRESVTDFSFPYYLESLTIISPAPAEKSRAFAALSPFTYTVWICIAIATMAIGPILTAETWFMKTYLTEEPEGYNLNNFSFNLFRSLVGQNNLLSSKYWPHRLTYFFWYLFCLNVLVLYSGTLTAVLVTPAFEKPIDHLTDLPEVIENGFTLGIVGDSSFENLFKAATEGIYKQTWHLFNHEDRAKSFVSYPDEGFDEILEGKFVFINSQLNSKIRATQRGLSNFYFARQTFYPQGYGIVCFMGAPFLQKFNQLLSYMTQGGLITKWADEEVTKVAGKSTPEGGRSGPTVVTLKHLQAAFFVLVFGFLMAGLALGLEHLSAKYKRDRSLQSGKKRRITAFQN